MIANAAAVPPSAGVNRPPAAVTDVLRSIGCRYAFAVIGGLAVSRYTGFDRVDDVDLLLDTSLRELFEHLLAEEPRGWRTSRMIFPIGLDGMPRGGVILRPQGSAVPEIDLVATDRGDYLRSVVRNARRIRAEGWPPLPVARPEDLVVMKRMLGRRHDFEDVLAIQRTLGSRLDQAYIDAAIAALTREKEIGS